MAGFNIFMSTQPSPWQAEWCDKTTWKPTLKTNSIRFNIVDNKPGSLKLEHQSKDVQLDFSVKIALIAKENKVLYKSLK